MNKRQKQPQYYVKRNGKELSDRRRDLRLTQSDFETLADITRPTIWRAEKGANIREVSALRIAAALRCQIEDIFIVITDKEQIEDARAEEAIEILKEYCHKRKCGDCRIKGDCGKWYGSLMGREEGESSD